MRNPEINYLLRNFYQIQEHRIAFGNQIFSLKKENKETNPLSQYYDRFHDLEKDIAKYIASDIKSESIWKGFLKDVKGIGPLLGSGLINSIDIREARHISSLWKYAGLDVRDGVAAKRKKGEKITWNPMVKMLCWKIGKSFLMSKSPYRKYYDERKKLEEERNKDFTKMHIHNRAMRYMVKRFLADFWVAWRELEGLEVTKPYVIDKLGHKEDNK